MKVAFRQQVSDYDCAPTSLLNALSYLFHRHEIPPFVVQRIYRESLDHRAAKGTTARAMREIGFWLASYREQHFKRFALATQYLSGKQVHLSANSKIISCIMEQGVALLSVHATAHERHYILALNREDDWLHCYDPYLRSSKFVTNDAVQFIEQQGPQQANLRIRSDWLDRTGSQASNPHDRKYIFGCPDYRECLLLNRIKP